MTIFTASKPEDLGDALSITQYFVLCFKVRAHLSQAPGLTDSSTVQQLSTEVNLIQCQKRETENIATG